MPGKQKRSAAADTIVIADLGRVTARLTYRDADLHDRLEELPTSGYSGPDEIVQLLGRLFEKARISPDGATLYLSVPTFVYADKIEIAAMPCQSVWRVDKAEIEARLGLDRVVLLNDLEAVGLALPEILTERSFVYIGKGIPERGFPIVVLSARAHVGTLGIVRDPRNDRMVPVQAEGGHMGLTPSSEREHEVMHALREIYRKELNRDTLTISAQDVLSAQGVYRLYQVVSQLRGVSALPLNDAKRLGELADANDAAALETIELWCGFFGSLARGLALAYGAFGGVYIAGALATDFLSPRKRANCSAFNRNFEQGGPAETYLHSIPRMLITHPNPYLKGLARLRPPPSPG